MLSKILDFVKTHFGDIISIIIVILISLLSFALGFLVAKYQEKEPIRIEEKETFYEKINSSTHCFVS